MVTGVCTMLLRGELTPLVADDERLVCPNSAIRAVGQEITELEGDDSSRRVHYAGKTRGLVDKVLGHV